MRPFDGHHKWGAVERNGIYISRTCSACGRTDTVETLIPDAVLAAITRQLLLPNPYRALVR